MGYYDHTPTAPKAKQDSSGAGGGSGGGSKTTPPPAADPSASDPNRGFDVGPVHFGFTNRGTPGVSWAGIPGWLPSSQRIHNVIDRTTNNIALNTADPITSAVGGGDLPALRLQRARMNQQMPTQDKAVADALGQFNPTLPLRSIPAVGPIVQGVAQEGVKGYAQGEQWPQIARDAVVGAAGGAGSGAVGTPQALGTTLGAGVTSGFPALAGWLYGGKVDDVLGGLGGPAGGAGAAMTGKYLLDPWNEAIKKAVSGSVPGWATGLGSQVPLAGASYWNQEQRDRATLSGQ
jgi:hypothetical protein